MITSDNTPAEVLDFDKALSVVFSRFGLSEEYQEKTIESACKEAGINPQFFIDILGVYNGEGYKFDKELFLKYGVDDILDYLRKTHVYYLNKKLPEIESTLTSLSNLQNHVEVMLYLNKFFSDYQKKFEGHIRYEEEYLFPYIESLVGKVDVTILKDPGYSIEKFETSHNSDIEDNLTEVREALVNFHPELLEESEFRVLLLQLHTFEKDLRIHGMVEDFVLIPKAKELETNKSS